DFSMPEKFDIEYTGEDNQKHRPVMLHRVVLGSLERFIGILIENYSGNLPPWLAPMQVIVLPISEKFYEYASSVYKILKDQGYRAEIDNRVESLSKKIKQAELAKIPYMVIIGQNEEQSKTVTVRKKSGQDLRNIKIKEFTGLLDDTIRNKKINP
ncbi:MAG: threonine--tRNA ligase, partial [Actinobacteria bacterium]|nr:threonine--tRNA ligase [Actinomycetota bacterium]